LDFVLDDDFEFTPSTLAAFAGAQLDYDGDVLQGLDMDVGEGVGSRSTSSTVELPREEPLVDHVAEDEDSEGAAATLAELSQNSKRQRGEVVEADAALPATIAPVTALSDKFTKLVKTKKHFARAKLDTQGWIRQNLKVVLCTPSCCVLTSRRPS
jgi:hypothetical protein